MIKVGKNQNSEILRNFLESPYPSKYWRVWGIDEGESLDPDVKDKFKRGFFGNLKIISGVNSLSFFKLASGNIFSDETISFPALELRFRDPENKKVFITGFIEGKENVNNFLREFAKKFGDDYNLDIIGKRLAWFEYRLDDGYELTDAEKRELRISLLALLGCEDSSELKLVFSRLKNVGSRGSIEDLSNLEKIELEYENLCREYLLPETFPKRKDKIRERLEELDSLLGWTR